MDFKSLRRVAGPKIRWLHLAVARYTRGLTVGVRAVVLDRAGRVLLIEHSYSPGWHLPGGGVQAGETIRDALARELIEEANVTITGPTELHGVFFNRNASRRDHVFVFVVRDWRQETPPKPSLEIIGRDFFAPDALPAEATTGTRARIAEVVGGAPATENW
jgi:ADP-ribose pyrophosphatase YjhB (NUDIX family)